MYAHCIPRVTLLAIFTIFDSIPSMYSNVFRFSTPSFVSVDSFLCIIYFQDYNCKLNEHIIATLTFHSAQKIF